MAVKSSFGLILVGVAVIVATCCGCTSGRSNQSGSDSDISGDTLTSESNLLTIVDCGGYVVADVRNPWGSGRLERYVLVGDDYKGDLPAGVVVKTPLRRSVVFSSVYGGAIDELGAIDAISGVADGRFFVMPSIAERIVEGRIADVGNSMSPSVESIVDCDPQAIIRSPYQGQESGAVERLGIPVVEMVDYMESTPLGRAEWLRLIGVLYGRRAEADSIYRAVADEYGRLCELFSSAEQRPLVVTEQPQPGGSWDLPAGESYMARMLADAGADYPWASTPGRGSLKLDIAEVYDKARTADYWLIRNYGKLTGSDLRAMGPLAGSFKALSSGGVYVCDTSRSPLFDEFPFHPERLLGDYIAIFHPQSVEDGRLRYFVRVSE